ncbi:hypothetical protein PG989_013312 [Apiospora arundinis]
MQLLDLPLDIFKHIILVMVQDNGLYKSMKTRFVCRTFANEVLDAVISTRVIEEIAKEDEDLERIETHFDVIARYLHHRVRADRPDAHPWISTIRETCALYVKHAASSEDLNPGQVEDIEFNACLCLAIHTSEVLPVLLKGAFDDKKELAGGTWENCLAIASWIDNLSLAESLHMGSDPVSFFGRPSWAAAAHGHLDVLQFFLRHGALPYEPTFKSRDSLGLGGSAIRAAAAMGHDKIVRFYLQPPYFSPEVQDEVGFAIHCAAETDQPQTLRTLLDQYKQTQTEHSYLSTIDCALRVSCRRGNPGAARVLLEYGADPNDTDKQPRSCLQYAVKSGDATTVKLLLDAVIGGGVALNP